MPADSTNPYLRTKVMTASPAELRLMLLDGAIKFARQGEAGLERRDYEAAYNGVSRCQSIVMELINGLRPEHAPELCAQLESLYTFLYTRLMRALTERDPAGVREVVELLEYERQTWTMVIDRLASENVAAGAMTETPEARPMLPGDGRGSDLVGGAVSVRG